MKPFLVALTAAALFACGAPPPPPGTALSVRTTTERGPRIPSGAIFAAGDLDTLRALVDAADSGMASQLGSRPASHECLPPYTNPNGSSCWPDQASEPGRVYLALAVQGGFCTTEGTPQLAVSGTHVELQIPFSDVFGCHANGSLALPTASLFWFPSDRLRAGLYSVSYVFRYSSDTYRSDSTYLSVPGPAPGQLADMDREAAAALTGVVGQQRGIFSLSRVDGSQLGRLCGETVASPAYLVTYETNPPRQMTVALAGPVPRTCATSTIGA